MGVDVSEPILKVVDMNHHIVINGTTLPIDLTGLKHSNPVSRVYEQCVGCGTDLAAEQEAYLYDAYGRHAIQCGACGTFYPIETSHAE